MATDLLAIEIETSASRYVFPDVPRAMLDNALKFGAWAHSENVILVNIHGACLSIPKRTVVRLVFGEEILWTA